MDIDPFNFADALLGILAQRLVRTLCPKCKEAYNPSKEEMEDLMNAYGPGFQRLGIKYGPDLKLNRAVGCAECNQTGYKGRTGLHELLVGTDEVKQIIARKASVEEIRQQAIKDGMTTLYQDGIIKIFQGITDIKQVRTVCIK
jgi:type II secretory ATPase GspE/PulE/Tfp pilus assembly ATPase PilB-like protein